MSEQAKLKAELASRVLSRRRLLPFIQRMNPKYLAGWVHKDICRRLERFSDDVAAGKSPRLMLLMPPRHGKSEIASKTFPAWHLGRHPDHEIIACSYNISLAMQFSRRVKLLLQDETYQTVFPETLLDPNNQSTEEWGIAGKRGAYVAAGIGGGITGKGAHCLPGTTLIDTEHGRLDIAHLYRLKSVPDILTPLGPRRALAITRRSEETTYTLRFTSGAVLEATGKHPVYLPDLAAYVTVEELYGQTESNGRLNLRVVRLAVPATEVRSRKVGEAGEHGVLLREGVQSGAPCSEACPPMPDMQQTSAGDASEPQRNVLFSGVPARADTFSAEDLPAMRRGISAETFVAGLLRTRLREYGAQVQDDWAQEFELQGRQFIRILVRPDAGAGDGAGQELRGVRHAGEVALPPHRRGSDTQRAGKSDTPVRGAPSRAPQVCYDTLSMVERRGGEPVEVYDLQVEEAGCFFADGILVGNCLIIDDPIKNAEEADSANTRESIWDWYGSTAYTRLAPGGGVLVIQTWWHDDDLAGRIQQAMAADEDADQFEIIKYPALAEEAEFLDTETDLIVRIPVDAKGEADTLQAANDAGYDIAPLKYLRSKGDPLHAARYDSTKLHRIKKTLASRFWSALYQQNPVPDDGMYFTKDQFRRNAIPGVKQSNVYISFDFAISEKQSNDYTVGSVGLQDCDDMLHVAEVIRYKSKDAFFIVDSILNMAQRWYHPSLTIGLEDGQIYRSIESLLKKRMRERKFYPSIEVLRPITDKQARARALQGRMQQGMISFNLDAEWYEVVRNEMLRFPAGVHDDCVDSLAWLAQLAVGKEAPRPPRAKQLPSWKDKLKVGGSGGSHMAA